MAVAASESPFPETRTMPEPEPEARADVRLPNKRNSSSEDSRSKRGLRTRKIPENFHPNNSRPIGVSRSRAPSPRTSPEGGKDEDESGTRDRRTRSYNVRGIGAKTEVVPPPVVPHHKGTGRPANVPDRCLQGREAVPDCPAPVLWLGYRLQFAPVVRSTGSGFECGRGLARWRGRSSPWTGRGVARRPGPGDGKGYRETSPPVGQGFCPASVPGLCPSLSRARSSVLGLCPPPSVSVRCPPFGVRVSVLCPLSLLPAFPIRSLRSLRSLRSFLIWRGEGIGKEKARRL